MISPSRGTLLIANPFLKDPNFSRTVIFLCEHTEEGSFGFVLNKKFPKNLEELLPDLNVNSFSCLSGRACAKRFFAFFASISSTYKWWRRSIERYLLGGQF